MTTCHEPGWSRAEDSAGRVRCSLIATVRITTRWWRGESVTYVLEGKRIGGGDHASVGGDLATIPVASSA